MESQPCPFCEQELEAPPLCYGGAAPWRLLGVPEEERDQRVQLTADQCVVDDQTFLLRAHIELAVEGREEPLAWSVWCSLSEENFRRLSRRWQDEDRWQEDPCFGWLLTPLPCYPETLHLRCSLQSRALGTVPRAHVQPSIHPLAVEQETGITEHRLRQIAHLVLHERGWQPTLSSRAVDEATEHRLRGASTWGLPEDLKVLEMEAGPAHVHLTRGFGDGTELAALGAGPAAPWVWLFTMAAGYHRRLRPVSLHDILWLGRPWLQGSRMDAAVLVRPTAMAEWVDVSDRLLQLLPVHRSEALYAREHGVETLRELLRSVAIANPAREPVI